MKRLLVALACALAVVGAQAQEAPKAKAKKAEKSHKAGVPKQKIWISPSDRQRLEKERAAEARAKKKESKK